MRSYVIALLFALLLSGVSRSYGQELREIQVSSAGVDSDVQVAINPTDSNNIVVIAATTLEEAIGFRPHRISLFCTKDFGKTWQGGVLPLWQRGVGAILGVQAVYDSNGELYIVWGELSLINGVFYSSIRWSRSVDGGITWSLPTPHDTIIAGVSQHTQEGWIPNSSLVSSPWIRINNSTMSPNYNSIYVSAVTRLDEGLRDSVILYAMKDRSMGFSRIGDPIIPIGDTPMEFFDQSQLSIDPDGNVHYIVQYIPEAPSTWKLGHRISTDGGLSFSPLTEIATMPYKRPVGIEALRSDGNYSFHIDQSTSKYKSNLYLVWEASNIKSSRDNELDIMFARSTDKGASWSSPKVLNDDAPEGISISDQYLPSITTNEQGVLSIAWYDRRDDITNVSAHYYVTHSFDGGNTFTPNQRVSSIPTDFSTVGAQNQAYGIGQRASIASTDGHAIVAWSDGRNNTGDLDIYVGFVPLQGKSSEVKTVSLNHPSLLSIHGLQPNPTASTTKVRYYLERNDQVQLAVLNIRGEVVQTIFNEFQEQGEHTFSIETQDLLNGTYFCQIRSTEEVVRYPFIIAR